MARYRDDLGTWQAAVDRRLRDLHTQTASVPTDATAMPWLSPASLGSGWTDLAATDTAFSAAGVQLLPAGRAAIRGGVIRTGSSWPAAGFTALTLPVEATPAAKCSFVCASPYGAGWVYVEILPSRSLVVWGWGGGTTGNSGSGICLDNIVYRIA
jgi:hypothetical protein